MMFLWAFFVLFKNEQECIVIFKNSRRSREFTNLIIYDYEFFERLQNLWYISLILALNFEFGVILVYKIGRKV